ncbi:hypothetical protein DFN06_003140 [Clostridium beijerinckii]|nr:hypothetical protein [Clostridium beijerinckii]NRZ27424.1 hypothetical protein [Clostridium beijerinckii]NYB96785.1 hypothetical protein [Clostridium beijerinckii]OOM22632.1 hypothetical protein CLBEI_31230 [Clostridium beijerinckii]SQB19905.1 Uncharacterised protein [Clostridium beijerinckii]
MIVLKIKLKTLIFNKVFRNIKKTSKYKALDCSGEIK